MINTPHFNAILDQILTEGKKSCSAKQAKKRKDSSKKAGATLKKHRGKNK